MNKLKECKPGDQFSINSEISDHVYGTIIKKEKDTPKILSLFKRR